MWRVVGAPGDGGGRLGGRDLVVGVTTSARCAAEIERAGGLGVLDLGRDENAARAALHSCRGRLGVRVAAGCPLEPADLPVEVDTIVLGHGSPWTPGSIGAGRRCLVEVASVAEAHAAGEAGARGLIARERASEEAATPGGTPGGPAQADDGEVAGSSATARARAGDRTSEGTGGFALMQRLMEDADVVAPVWVAGGIGTHTGPAAVAGGATGVVLDTQLALDGHRVPHPRGLVRAMRASIRAHIGAAVTTRPLAAGSAFAAAHGLRHPFAAVTDRPALAAAIVDAGGLPFLRGGDLQETAALLGDRPWGVSAETPDDVRPPFALVDGERHGQAARLQAAGIETFLRVPSPALLDRCLAAGARRLVLDAPLPVWDAQVERLLAYADALDDVHVLFAGGIHDARSAAMAAALAAPLAERGAGIGVVSTAAPHAGITEGATAGLAAWAAALRVDSAPRAPQRGAVAMAGATSDR